MEFSEHSTGQASEQKTPANRTSSLTNLENLQQTSFPKQSATSSHPTLGDRRKPQAAPISEVSNAPDDQGTLTKHAEQSQEVSHQKGPDWSKRGAKDFIWTEDLSENGQKLYLLLLGDIGDVQYLPEMAKMEGIDLDVGLQELRSHGVLDENDPTIILLNIFHKKR